MTKNENVEVIKKEKVQDTQEKAYFFKRFAAYIIDILIVSLIASLVLLPFPENKNLTKINQEIMTLNQKYLDQKIEVDTYISQSIELSRDASYENVIPTIIELTLIILYFIVFQFYNKGQTLGKKLLHIRVVKEDSSELSMNDLIFRSLIIHSIFINMIALILTLCSTDTVYFYGANALQVLQEFIIIISSFMVIYRKDGRGIHDFVAKTKVIAE